MTLFLSNDLFSQLKDTVYGKAKSVREELVFLDKDKQNYRLFDTDGDYGHMGFTDNKGTKNRFYSNWYNSAVVHYLNFYIEFNEKGNPENEIWFYKNGDTICNYKYLYNENDKLIQMKEIFSYDNSIGVTNYSYKENLNTLQSMLYYWSDDPESFRYDYYIYDKEDYFRLVETNSYNHEGGQGGTKYVYDIKGRKKKKLNLNFWVYEYHKDGSSSYFKDDVGRYQLSEEYFYDENDRLIEIHHYRNIDKNENEQELGSKTKNFYTTNGSFERIIITTELDTIRYFSENKYDKKGRKIESIFVHKCHEKNKNNLLYDKKNIKLDGIIIPKTELCVTTKLKYKYDQNNLIELTVTQTFGETFTATCKFEYVFDEKNNWIEQIKYVNGEKLYVWKRKIEYY